MPPMPSCLNPIRPHNSHLLHLVQVQKEVAPTKGWEHYPRRALRLNLHTLPLLSLKQHSTAPRGHTDRHTAT